MSIGRLNFDEIAEADLRALIESGVPEGIGIEYKRQVYGRADDDTKEFLKDVSSFANTTGGHLVIGIAEEAGIAKQVLPILELEVDKEILRLENLVRDCLQPRVSGVRMRAIPIGTGGFVIVVRIPKSWNPPHRVGYKNTNRFWVRNSGGAHEASVEELRGLFSVGAAEVDRVRAFRRERLAKVSSGEATVPLAAKRGRLLLHIVPLSAFSGPRTIDLHKAYKQLQGALQPIFLGGFTPQFNFDGFVNTNGSPLAEAYTQVFRNGCLEAVHVGIAREHDQTRFIASMWFEEHVIRALPRYLGALRSLEVPAPFVVALTLEDVADAVLWVSSSYGFSKDAKKFRAGLGKLNSGISGVSA